jgi:PAS domain S-box-containing protein
MGDGPGGPRRTRWVDRSLRAKGLVVIAVPVCILVAILGTTFWFAHVDNRAQDLAARARQIVDDATTLENSVLSAQTAVDAWLLTGGDTFRTSYAGAVAGIPGELTNLAAATADDATTHGAMASITREVDRMTFDLAQLSLQPPSPVPTGTVRALLRFSRVETDLLRADIAGLSTKQEAFVATQRSAIHTSSTLLPAIALGAVALAIAGGVVMSQFFTAGVVRRLRRLERATDALERGEVPEVVPTGRDEIGRLSVHMLSSATQLRERAVERDRARKELEDILTASPVVSLCYDVAARRFSYASPNIDRLLGITAERAMADPGAVMVRFHPDTNHRLRDEIVGGGGRHGERFDLLARFRRDPRTEDWLEADAVYSVESGEDGVPSSVIAYLVDVSERHVAQRAADERRFLLESIFHASPDTIVVRDTTGRVLLASSPVAEAADASGVAAGDAVGWAYPLSDAAQRDRDELERAIARCLAGEHDHDPVVTTGHLPDGGARTYETRARPVLDQAGRVTGTVTVSRDVTDRFRLEQSLREASSAALRESEAKSEFLSRMSHELRTPLNAILGFAQLLELDELPPDQASSVDQIQVAGKHLLALINEVLDISRIEAGRLTLSTEPVDVGSVLDEVATLLVPVAESATIAMSVDGGSARALYVQADRQRLLQVLLNLGSNAVKYNSRGGSVAFLTRTTEGGRIRFEVSDTGPGIAYEQQDKLFLPFSRLGAERSGVEGTGVGLALSKQLVEVMGGSIGVESTPGRGSTFWVELLRANPPERADEDGFADGDTRTTSSSGAGARAATRSDGRGDGNPRGAGTAPDAATKTAPVVVLHIEDNPSNASLVEQILAKRAEVRLVSAAEGRSGLELARQHRPDLVLLDLHLPDLGGDELFHRLKAVPELADTKVVVVSADATPSRIRSMLDLGVEDYLTKPVDVEALLRLVDHEIGVRQRERR